MKIGYIYLTTILLLSVSLTSQALVIDGKEWRQLLAQPSGDFSTLAATWNEFDAVFDTITGQCETPSCTVKGTDYSGYTWASINEVDNFLNALFPAGGSLNETTSSQTVLNTNGWDDAFDIVGDTFATTYFPGAFSTRIGSGWTRDTSASDANSGGLVIVESTYNVDGSVAESNKRYVFPSKDMVEISFGAWMYKSVDVSEPNTMGILALGLAGLMLRNKRTK